MNVSCPSCNTVFRVDPAKVPEGGVRARCTACRSVFRVSSEIMPDSLPPAPAPEVPATTPQPAAKPAFAPSPEVTAPTPVTHSAPSAQPTSAPAPRVPLAPMAAPAAPPGQDVPAAPVAPREPVAAPRGPAPPVAAPVSGRPVMPPAAPGGQAAPATPSRRAAPAPKRATGAPINPFLSQDPNQKARRLARALVSDLVVYHPDKRQEGLRDGTLKDLFDDEIKKSWEEYIEQIGTDVADAASFFNDALNEILSDGRKMF